ncbi:unnamed protein product [Pleuronectes platessa]|uniref:Uncharacterized protein n=1 Tax=Pleuronectes platessa TaxID=8262 RepID=A0A9N7UAE2_PLEPL|nr:unnamed protein product [Pleuronectes platessa]
MREAVISASASSRRGNRATREEEAEEEKEEEEARGMKAGSGGHVTGGRISPGYVETEKTKQQVSISSFQNISVFAHPDKEGAILQVSCSATVTFKPTATPCSLRKIPPELLPTEVLYPTSAKVPPKISGKQKGES